MTRDGISYTLILGVVKYIHLLMVLSALIFILWGCCPMVLLSIFPFLCPPTWPHDENVDCPHLYHVIIWPEMGYRTPWWLEGKIFSSFMGFVRLDFYQVGLLSYGAFVHFWLFSVHPRDRMARMLIVHTCIMWSHDQRWDIVHLDVFSSKIFSCILGFVRLAFYPLRLLSYGAFVHFSFSLSAQVTAWRECWLSTPVSCDHMDRDGYRTPWRFE